MYLQSDSAAGVRFMAAMAEGRGVKPSARAAGVGKETGFRWLRERFLASRALGVSVADAQAELGYFSARVVEWPSLSALRETPRASGFGL
jgi:transposase, IS30 family